MDTSHQQIKCNNFYVLTFLNQIVFSTFEQVFDLFVLMHTLEKFHASNAELILVLHADYHDYWKNLCVEFSFDVPHLLVQGGINNLCGRSQYAVSVLV